jgi:hypothetical protein
MNKIPTLKGSQLSVGQRVAWPVYLKKKEIKDSAGKQIPNYFKAATVLTIDNEYIELYFIEEGEENFNEELEITRDFILLKSNTDKDRYDDTKSLRVNLFDENEYLRECANQIDSTIKSINKQYKNLENNEEQVNSAIFKVAKILATVKDSMFMTAGKKHFSSLKKQAVSKLSNDNSTRTLNKAIRVASDKRILANQHKLPNTYSVLYSLTSLSNDEFEKLLKDEDVTPDITRNQLIDKVNEIKGKELKLKPQKYTITRTNEIEASDDHIEELKTFLESKGWTLKKTQSKETVEPIQTPKS